MPQSWNDWYWNLGLASLFAIGGANPACCDSAQAQIVPDATLGAESSVVTPLAPGSTIDEIGGGAVRGANLFHSFEQFSVLTGRSAYFNNAPAIQNIISRVTGGSRSNIDGLLRANGTANLFLLNPNGMIFGPNASLNIGGSFVASTASAINFADGTQFSATAPQTTPLLTVSVPLGLQYGGNAGSILNQSQATNSSGKVVGLQVPSSKTLALLGGNVTLDGGSLNARGGQVEIAGVAEPGVVGLNVDGNNLSLSFPDNVARADVSFTNGAAADVAAEGGGRIAINAKNIDVLGGSLLFAGIGSGLGSVGSQAGDITLNATGAIAVASSEISNLVSLGAVGNGGNITITAESLSLTDSSLLVASTLGRGNAGSILVQANGNVSLSGASTIFNTVDPQAIGNVGGITLQAGSFSLTEGAELQAATEGQGNAGNVTVQVSDRVSFDGVDEDGFASGIFATVFPSGIGRGGDIKLTAGSLSITNGARMQTKSEGQGDTGNVTIEARDRIFFDGAQINSNPEFEHLTGIYTTVETDSVRQGGDIYIKSGSLFVNNGAQLTANTFGQGNAGNVTIEARDRVSFDGVNSRGGISGVFSGVINDRLAAVGQGGNIQIAAKSLSVTNGAVLSALSAGQGNAGSVTINAGNTVSFDGKGPDGFPSGVLSTVEEGAIGDGGGINITAGALVVSNGARLAVFSRGSNNKAGNIVVAARSIRLDNQAVLSAETQGVQGDITLRSPSLILRRGSSITTNATGNEVIGGNITLDTDILAALENSDISANSENFFGGRIAINAQGIFGTQFRLTPTPESDITATGGRPELSGTVQINTPDFDPSRGLVTLPTELVDVTGLIAQSCPGGGGNLGQGASELIVTGRGGLPPSPDDALSSDAVVVGLATPARHTENRPSPAVSKHTTSPTPDTIVEATGWVIGADGQVILTAAAPTVTPQIPWLTPVDCHAP